ncbi:chromosomal replication initiator DnaA [Ancylobacter sp. A5.8]|uniref:helix-turn-helix domain-containing protein n=1 Tax=Ancylobacter gelatini TaxID=2919920 RepID=UPI001F4DEEF6|nr:helix-turn-helix domain-containing protein [Ancylobacter gelatini]MCJ8143794.1 chromosomal replication initiator DnaA [Ancylobacter gelatini]
MLYVSPSALAPPDARACLISARAAALAAGVPLGELFQPSRRSRASAGARALAMYLAHVGLGLPISRVATGFGRHRSTVVHACRRIEESREAVNWDLRVGTLEDEVRRATAGEAVRHDA